MTVTVSTKPAKQINSLLGQMTLDEKLAQIGSYWIYELQTKGVFDQQKMETKLRHGIGQITRLAGASTMGPSEAAKTANKIQRYLMEGTRLRIPAIIHEESCSGAMVIGGTRFPQMLGVAASFQPELAEHMAATIRKQLRAIGAHQGLAPVLDVSRDQRWGRIEETFGEDPMLVAHFGAAYIRGLQGDLTSGVMATGKHFVGHSLSLGGLNCAPVQVGWNDLWNTSLPSFQAAIRDADLASIMCAYPEVDGEVVAGSKRILTDLLRGKLGFKGLLVSDYHAVNMIYDYHYAAAGMQEAAVKALEAGVDVELPSVYGYGNPLRAALEAGHINLEFVDAAVARHLEAKVKLGLFDDPYVDEGKVPEVFDRDEDRALATDIAAQTLVLLKNDGLLPLSKKLNTIAVIGPNADSVRNQLGDYSYVSTLGNMTRSHPKDSNYVDTDLSDIIARTTEGISLLDGVQASLPDARILYAQGCDNLGPDTSGFGEAIEVAKQADVIILALGDRSGFLPDCTTGETRDSATLQLPGVQAALATQVIATGKPVVVVLINGRPFSEPWLHEHANAILEAWLPGEQGGIAIAQALLGDVNPGGKLPVSIPRHVGQLPMYYNYKPSGVRSNWHVNYVEESVEPLYPFGYGLSYTEFEYSNLKIDRPLTSLGGVVAISVNVKNAGQVAGHEVVQLYARDIVASSPRPVQELKGYARIGLKPGETRKVTFHLPVNSLAFVDPALELVLEAGKIDVMVGASSADIRLRGEFEIIEGGTLALEERIFDCPVEVA